MNLKDIGWNDHFQQQMDHLNIDNAVPGRVFKVTSSSLGVITEGGEIEARVPGRLKNEAASGSDLPGIGDWVMIKRVGTTNMIFKVLPRTSKISRKVPGKGSQEQLIAANIDLIFVVMGLDNDYNPRRLERYLTMVAGSGAHPVIILNKADLIEEDDGIIQEVERICGDIPFHVVSALNDTSLDDIKVYLQRGTTIALVGSSGAGKSTMINTLLEAEVQRTGAVREDDSRGRHVTSSRELFIIPGGGLIIDNPGIREIQLWGKTASLELAFQDIEELSRDCRFKDCRHLSEPDCAVQVAIEKGTLSKVRYNNYQKMVRELDSLASRTDKSSEAAEKEKWKPIMKGLRNYYKYKKGKE